MKYSIEPIGCIQSCFKEKFGIPRQPLLAPAATGVLILHPPYDRYEAIEGLDQVSHIWLTFLFHQAMAAPTSLKVRPPRLGGNRSLGVFATRSTHRPNHLGQSVVRLDRLEPGRLYLSGIDLVDGTPVIDIKPYVPYADVVVDAANAIAPTPPSLISVEWSTLAWDQAITHQKRLKKPVTALIEQCLAQDPRPAYHHHDADRLYGFRLWDLNIRWRYPRDDAIKIMEIQRVQA